MTKRFLVVLALLFLSIRAYPEHVDHLRIAMLHLALDYAAPQENSQLIEKGIRLAAEHHADWVMTPELALTGYRFDLSMGTDWIGYGPDQYVEQIQSLAKQYGMSVFLSHLEKVEPHNTQPEKTFNTLFVIDSTGTIVARHRKINTIPTAEDWSEPGELPAMVTVDNYQVGLLICADAWPPDHADNLKNRGAELLLSTASWAPGKYGPGDVWERRSKQTGLPLFVNNRTGIEREFDLRKSASVVSKDGKRLFTHQSSDSQLLLIDWNAVTDSITDHQTIPIN